MSSINDISVVITCYNYKSFVSEAIESALAQRRCPTQIIVVDDGSTDGSRELLQEKYGGDSRITLVTGENGGQLVAFRRGMSHVRSPIVAFLDADDRWKPDYLEKIAAIYDQNREIDFVFTDITFFGNEQGGLRFATKSANLGHTCVLVYLMGHWYGSPTSAISMRKELAKRSLDLPASMDSMWRISADNCLVYGASMLWGRKYYLDTHGSMEYRVHGKNGWWSRRTPENEYVNALRSRCLIEHYAKQIGLNESCKTFLHKEFLSKMNPSWEEAVRYAMARYGKTRLGWSLKRFLRAYKLYWKRRH